MSSSCDFYYEEYNFRSKLTLMLGSKLDISQGPVVQSIFSSTSSLRGQVVKSFMTL